MIRGRGLILLPTNGCSSYPGATCDMGNNSHIQLAQSPYSEVCGLFLGCLVCPEAALTPCVDPAWCGFFRVAGLWPLGHPCGPGSALRSQSPAMPSAPQSTTLERQTEGCPPAGQILGTQFLQSPACFTLTNFQMGRLIHRKSPGNVSWEGCGELLGGRGGAGPGWVILALTQEIWGRGGLGRFEIYDSTRASKAKG